MNPIKEIKWFFKQLKRSLGYFRASWGGYDWDYNYSINMFKYSLQRLHDNLNSDKAYSTEAKQNARRLKTIIDLMKKVYDDRYALEYQGKMKALYGEDVLDFWFEDTGRGNGTSYLRFEYEKWDNEEEIDKMYSKLIAESRSKQDKAHKLLWKLVEHNIRKMWD
jgi:hypothetical protein